MSESLVNLQYNSQQERLIMPEYGRNIQRMVQRALSLEDRKERQKCAETIINVMANLFPQLKEMPDFQTKLWDHLAIMSDFKLDVDYPEEIVRPENLDVKPERVYYPATTIRFKHYGAALEAMIEQAVELEDPEAFSVLVELLANQMKKSYLAWNKEGVEDKKIFDDLRMLSLGKIDISTDDLKLKEFKDLTLYQSTNSKKKKKK